MEWAEAFVKTFKRDYVPVNPTPGAEIVIAQQASRLSRKEDMLMPTINKHRPMLLAAVAAVLVFSGPVYSREAGPLNSPVRSKNPDVFNNQEVLSHLAPAIWSGNNLAYTNPAPTIPEAQTQWARMMPKTIQEVIKGRIYHAYGFQLASTLIVVGDKGLIVIDPGSDDDSARATREAFRQAVPASADLPVVAIIYSHRHPDHAFGSGGWGGNAGRYRCR
jgi:Metallo-beta-lactamase superfamily